MSSPAPFRHRGGIQGSGDSFTSVSYSHRPSGYAHGRGGGKQTLGGACTGALIGILLLFGATILLWTNEADAVRAQQALSEARLALDTGKGGLVHVVGELAAELPVQDDAFGIRVKALKLERNVEVYQWREHTSKETRRVAGDGRGGEVVETSETKRYDTDWESREISSQRFAHPHGHRNPTWSEALQVASEGANQLPFDRATWEARNVHLNGLTLSSGILTKATRTQALQTNMDAARTALDGSRAKVVGASIYSDRGCAPPHQPHVGCVRVSWRHAPLEEVSVLAKKTSRGQLREWPSSAGPGYDVALVEFGDREPYQMLESASAAQAMWTWFKRGGGIVLTWIGWALLFGPAQYVASWIPLLSGLVGCVLGLIALGVALAHSLTVIALAWLAQRPIIAGTLLAIVAGTLYYLVKFLRGRQRGAQRGGGSSSTSSSSGGGGGGHFKAAD